MRRVHALMLLGAFLLWLVVRRTAGVDLAPPDGGGAEHGSAGGLSDLGDPSSHEARFSTSEPASDGRGDGPPAAPRDRRIRIEGTFFDLQGNPVSSAVTAFGAGAGARTSVTGRSDVAGRFGLAFSLERTCDEVVVVGESGTDSRLVTYPSRHHLPPGEGDVALQVVLVGRLGAQLEGYIAQAAGGARSRAAARALLSELPTGSNERYVRWNVAGFAAIDRFIIPSDDGSFRVAIRPGDFRVRLVGEDGSLGASVSGTARAGDVIRLGTLPSVASCTEFHVHVLTAAGAPVAAAWLQLTDRMIHVASGQGASDFPHFVADERGVIDIRGIPVSDLPISAAVGSAENTALDLELAGPGGDVHVVLAARPRLRIRLTGESASTCCSALARELTLRFTRSSESSNGAEGTPTFARRIDEAVERPGFGIVDAERRLAWTHRPADGRYDMTLLLGQTVVARRVLDVSTAISETDEVELAIERGRSVDMRIDLPDVLQPSIVRDLASVRLGSREDRSATLELAAAPLLDATRTETRVWVPSRFDTVTIATRNACLLPITPDTTDIEASAKVILHPRVRGDVSLVTIRVVGRDGQALEAPWPVHLLSPGNDSCDAGITSFDSDSAGRLMVLLRYGEYEVRSERSFIEPFARRTFVVRPDGPSEVVLPLVN